MSDDGSARLWSAEPNAAREPVVFSSVRDARLPWQGDVVLTLTSDGKASLFSLAGELRSTLVNRNSVTQVAFATRVAEVLTVDDANRVNVYSYAGEERAVRPKHSFPHDVTVNHAHLSSDGTRLAIATDDGAVRIHFLDDPKRASQLLHGHQSDASYVEIGHKGSGVLTLSKTGDVRLWSLDSGEFRLRLQGHEGPVTQARFSPDGSSIVTAGVDDRARVWTVDGQREPMFLSGAPGTVTADSAPGENGRVAIVTADTKQLSVREWNGRSINEVATVKAAGVKDVSIRTSHATTQVIYSQYQTVWRVAVPNEASEEVEAKPQRLGSSSNEITLMRVSDAGNFVVTASDESKPVIWGPKDAKVEIDGHEQGIREAVFSPTESELITVGNSGKARRWSTSSGKMVGEYEFEQEERIFSAGFSPDEKWVVLTTGRGRAQLRATAAAQSVDLISKTEGSGHTGAVLFATFSSDSKKVVTAGSDAKALVWDLSQTEPLVLEGHDAVLRQAQFDEDATHVITVDEKGTVGVWDLPETEVEGRTTLAPQFLLVSDEPVVEAAFFRNRSEVLALAESGNARVWSLRQDQLIELACAWAGRELSTKEWEKYARERPGMAYKGTCSPTKTATFTSYANLANLLVPK